MLMSITAAEEISAFAQWLDTSCRSFDLAVFKFFGSLHADWLSPIVRVFTRFGDSEFVIPMMILGLILCLSKKTRRCGMTMFFAILVGTLITNVVLKPLIFRPRPYVSLSPNEEYMMWYNEVGSLIESDRSFPSGHTTAAFEIGIALLVTVKNNKIRWLFPVYSVLIGCSRLYLMVHYCTDVIGGIVCGTVAAIIAILIVNGIMKLLEKSDNSLIKKINGIDLFFKTKPKEETAEEKAE